MISYLIITVSHMAIEVDIHDRFTWGILPCLSFSSNVISHLTTTVTFMMNSIGESRHVGHSIIRFKSIYFYAVNSLIVQYMHTCIYLTDISNTNNSNQYTYTYMYFSNSIHNRSQSHLSFQISLSYYLFKDILNLILIHGIIYIYSFICSFTYTHSYTYSHMHSCILIHTPIHIFIHTLIHIFIHVFSFMYTHS